MIKFIIILISLTTGLVLVNLNNVSSYSEDYSNQTTKTNNTNLDISNFIYDIDSNPFNVSYADWTEKWWQWTYSIPWDKNPSYDDTGKYCSENQSGPVWFLTLAYGHPVTRICVIPENTALLITLLNSECSCAEFTLLKTEEGLRECAKRIQDLVVGGNASLNKMPIPNLENYRVQTDIFNFTLPENNILNLTSQTTHAVADGNWLFLKPLPAGTHELKVKGDINATSTIMIKGNEYNGPVGWNYTTTYILNVR
ncbi:MAG TPA: hypothetical protein VE595_05515 [Nitrososphaeraceae archaeon]|nr:hypothetical protein [Nitrososphaeraceae archaeon]